MTSAEHSKVIRLRVRMRDLIDGKVLESAVKTTMKRYPYFCVKIQRKGSEYYYVQNKKPVIVSHSKSGVSLNSTEANEHMLSFSWYDNWFTLDIFHGLTDGTGAYELMRTLLYYYCSERYGVELKGDGIRLLGDIIEPQEYENPADNANLPLPERKEYQTALNLITQGGLENDTKQTVYSLAIPETEFMRFTSDNDGSPGTMVALLLSRAVAKLYPDCKDVIRVALCVNQRGALNAPLAHQCLVGAAMLEYKDKLRSLPLDRQATIYRGMVFAQTLDEKILSGVAKQQGLAKRLEACNTDEERFALAKTISDAASRIQTALVSYVGKANYKEAEQYIRDFRTLTCAETPVLIEISAVNGRFVLDFIQHFSSPVYVNAFLSELDENDITFDLQDVKPLELPDIELS